MLTNLKADLEAYAVRYKEERATAENFIALIQAQSEACLNRTAPAHLTASAWIENQTGECFLLTKHKKAKLWLQLGGHVEGNPDILAEALREAREESGLKRLAVVEAGIFDLGIYAIPYGPQPHWHYDVVYWFRSLEPDEAIRISDESDALEWFESLPEGHGGLERMLQKWKNRVKL